MQFTIIMYIFVKTISKNKLLWKKALKELEQNRIY